jgi:hypothetical protein
VYCDAARCVSANRWLPCACTVSDQICDAVEAFSFRGVEGALLAACVPASPGVVSEVRAKGGWFLSTNACIFGHWRAAFEAINDPGAPIPAVLTPEWTAAVTVCRRDGIGSKTCCEAHVVAEQNAIDRCGPYDSVRFGTQPTDVPGSPFCSRFVPGTGFSGDFGKVADRIAFGKRKCCP